MSSVSVDTDRLRGVADAAQQTGTNIIGVINALYEDCPNEASRLMEVVNDLAAIAQVLTTVRVAVEEGVGLPTAGVFMLSLGIATGSFDPANPGFDSAPIYNADGYQISPPYDAPPGTYWALVSDPTSTRPDQEHAGNYVLLVGEPPPGASLLGMVWQVTFGTVTELYHGIVDSFENAMNRSQIGSRDAPNPLGLPTGVANAAADSAPLNNAILSVTGIGELYDGDLSPADLLALAQLAGVVSFWTGGGGAIGSALGRIDEVPTQARAFLRAIRASGASTVDQAYEDLLAYSTALGRPSWKELSRAELQPYLSRQVNLQLSFYNGDLSDAQYRIATQLIGRFDNDVDHLRFASYLQWWPADLVERYIDYAQTYPVFLASHGTSISRIEDIVPALGRFGSNLTVYGDFGQIVANPQLNRALVGLARLNNDVVQDFIERGGTIMIGEAPYPSFPGAWQSVGQAPRGHPTLSSHSQLPAAASGSQAAVGYVAGFMTPSNVAVHEMGHVVDFTSGYLSQSDEFLALYDQFEDTLALRAAQDDLSNSELAALAYFRQPDGAGASEYFAEAYAAVLLNHQSNLYRLTLGNTALEQQLIEYMSTFGTPSAIPYGLPLGGPR